MFLHMELVDFRSIIEIKSLLKRIRKKTTLMTVQ